jgi:hypothetical protein
MYRIEGAGLGVRLAEESRFVACRGWWYLQPCEYDSANRCRYATDQRQRFEEKKMDETIQRCRMGKLAVL